MPATAVTKKNTWSLLRTEERQELICNVVVSAVFGNSAPVHIGGLTLNVSKSGACLYICRRLCKGIEMTVTGKIFGNIPKKGRLVWCQQVNRTTFKIGVSFLPALK